MKCKFWQLILPAVITLFPHFGSAQVKDVGLIKRTYNKFFSTQETDTTRGSSFFVLPALGYAQETGLEFGIGSSYNFYTDRSDPNSRTSTITLIGTVTTEKQKNIKLNTDVWTRDNQYHILSEIRYRDWPFNFYGIGNTTQHANEEWIGQRLFRARIDVERKIFPDIYAGLNANFENFEFESFETDGVFQRESFRGKPGGKHLILGTSLLYDTRNFTTYTTAGWYGRIKYGYAPNFFGGENFNGHQLETDVRHYYPINNKLALAAQIDYRGTYGSNAPFYVYNELGGDNMLRGYYLGRYRDKNFLAAQAEARYRFHPRFGITAFLGTGSTFSNEQNIRMVPSYGAGLRYFFNLEHKTTVRFDYAIGEKRPGEQRQKGFYLSLSEAF
ncbi:BamA/TamA family outer membrane protein [Sphingobacterium corticis]|uniref:BamA/TamA family outer membrane protein n=1 Tax=Sphingobacterium corticis TaxID=1812823 RepID=A0ABW5NNL8_9SPHI